MHLEGFGNMLLKQLFSASRSSPSFCNLLLNLISESLTEGLDDHDHKDVITILPRSYKLFRFCAELVNTGTFTGCTRSNKLIV